MVKRFSRESCSKCLKMEDRGSCSKREGKRRLDDDEDDGYGRGNAPKQLNTPDFARVMSKARKLNGLEKMFPKFEPLIRKILREEMQKYFGDQGELGPFIRKIFNEELKSALKTCIPGNLPQGALPRRIQESGGRKLQLRFETKMPDNLFAGKKVEGEGGSAIYVKLIDRTDGSVVKTGPESAAKLDVSVLEGHFGEDSNDGWTHETFKRHQVKERDRKAPILIGDLQVALVDGVGILGVLSFTDNSSWTRTKKFRLGVELAPGFCEGTCVMGAKTEAFGVLDQRGQSYRKHFPPFVQDEVYRLKGIAKGKPLHDKLLEAGIITVEDLLRLHAKDPRKLRNMIGTGMTDKKWKSTIEHAKTCDFSGGKSYVFYTDASQSYGVVLDHIHELKGLICDGKFLPLESHAHTKEISYHVKKAYENWNEVVEYDDHDLQSFTTMKEIEASREEQGHSTDHNVTHIPFNHQYSTPEYIQKSQSNNMSDQPQFRLPLADANQTYMEEQFINFESFNGSSAHTTDEIPGVGCSNRFEDLLLPNDSLIMNSLAEEQMENPGFNFNAPIGEEFDYEDIFGHSIEKAEPKYDEKFEADTFTVPGMNRGKAVVGWLKIKVALRWGIITRKKAAARRFELAEME